VLGKIVGSSPDQCKLKTKIGIDCFSTKHAALRSKGRLVDSGIRIM